MSHSKIPIAVECIIIMMATFALQACASSGGPIVKHGGQPKPDTAVWNEPLIEGCLNVSMAKRIRAYETRYHHSKETSLIPEVLQTGVRIELDHQGETDPTGRLRKEFSKAVVLQLLGLDGRDRPFEAFCMHYDAPVEVVTQIVEETLPVLGNPVKYDRERIRQYYTDFLGREHLTLKWRDAYVIDAQAIDNQTSAVQIYRHLQTLRAGDQWVYAQSDGHNEAWFLQWVKTSLPR